VRRSFQDKIWIPIQGLALMALIFTPLLVHHDLETAAPKILREVMIDRDSDAEGRPLSIASRVVVLPDPFATSSLKGLNLKIETRQFRFAQALEPGASRSPSSTAIRSSEKWTLSKILRRVGDKKGESWEEVDLIRDESDQPVGSVYLELDTDSDEFMVTYRGSRKGQERKVLVHVSYQPYADES
jgi:hypothetical protein